MYQNRAHEAKESKGLGGNNWRKFQVEPQRRDPYPKMLRVTIKIYVKCLDLGGLEVEEVFDP